MDMTHTSYRVLRDLYFCLLFQEYIQDGIDWTRVDFEDNQDCLSLFEKVM